MEGFSIFVKGFFQRLDREKARRYDDANEVGESSNMKLIFAPDSFKGTLTAVEICKMLCEAAEKHFPQAELLSIPMADGGEGTVDALVLAGKGRRETVTVSGPMGQPVEATYGILEDGSTAVLEMAQASGLPLAPMTERDPLHATSRGTGEMLRHVLERGYRKILLGIGGSATNDGGMGLLSALGMVFRDGEGRPLAGAGQDLARVEKVDASGLLPALGQAEIRVICDVTNPLLGETGATAVYGRQKGATPQMQQELEQGMAHYAQVMEKVLGRDISSFPGAGAAGGAGAALAGVLGARLMSGIQAVLDAVDFSAKLAGAHLVVTGEGRMDGQSVRFGKGPAGIAKRAAQEGVPVVAIVGSMEPGAEELYDLAEASILTTINAPMPVETAMEQARSLFLGAADRMFRLLKIGQGLPKE